MLKKLGLFFSGLMFGTGSDGKRDHLGRRIIMSVAGVLIGAVCVALFKLAAFGVDPFQSLMAGLDKLIPIDFGTLYVIVNAVLLIFSLVTDRHYIGLATFINLFLLGYVTEFTLGLLTAAFPAPSMALRCVCLVIGIVVICIGSALYITADLGVSTYDAVALVISGTWKKGKFKYVRIITDVVCVVLGGILFLLGGGQWSGIPAIIGVGTIITAFFMGPLVDFFNRKIAQPLLK